MRIWLIVIVIAFWLTSQRAANAQPITNSKESQLSKPRSIINYTIFAYDALDSIPLVNANVSLGAQHAFTDSSGKVVIPINTTWIDEQQNTSPESFYLQNNFPNPFNKETKINFGIKENNEITIVIYTINGEALVRENYSLTAGHYVFSIEKLMDIANQPLIVSFEGNGIKGNKKIMKLGSGKAENNIIKLEKTTGKDEYFKSDGNQAAKGIIELIVEKNHYFSYIESINSSATDTVVVKYINPKMKDAALTIQNCDTDSTDLPAYAIVNSKRYEAPSGTLITQIKEADEYTIITGTYKHDGVTPFSFKRTIRKQNSETINDTVRVVDWYLRNMVGQIVDSMYVQGISPVADTSKMNPARFKSVMRYLHYHNFVNGRPPPGYNFPDLINGYVPEDRLPPKIVIAKKAYYFTTQTTHQFNQQNIDAIISDINEYVQPFIDRTIPIEIADSIDVGAIAPTASDYALIIPQVIPAFGYGSIVGTQSIPATIIFGTVTLNSDSLYAWYPNLPVYHAARIQELYTVIFGLNGNVTDDILTNKESCLNNSVNITNPTFPTRLDYKIIKNIVEQTYKRGEHIDVILGL